MAENIQQEYETKAPRGLFSRIMRRLVTKRQYQALKRYVEINSGALVLFVIVGILAFIGLWQVISMTPLFPLLSLMRSDPGMIVMFRHSFVLSVMESVPGLSMALFFAVLGFVLLFVRLLTTSIEKLT